MLDLNEVRIFVQVVRLRSFAEAARKLSVPANTLSRRVRQLEAALDTRLMQRSTRKLTLTAAGSAFFAKCAPAVDGMLDAGRAVIGGSQAVTGSIRIAAPVDFLDWFKMEWVAKFLALHPQVRLDFVLNDARADMISEGIDVAFRGGFVKDSQFIYRQLAAHSFKLVASAAYLQANGTPDTLQSLAKHECLIGSGRQEAATWTLAGPHGSEEVQVRGRFCADSARILQKACVSGLGIALLPSILIADDLKSNRLVRVLPFHLREGANFSVVLPSLRQIPNAVAAFVAYAGERLQPFFASEDLTSAEAN
jgi:DNA-binding transcriptional LysR family regulator